MPKKEKFILRVSLLNEREECLASCDQKYFEKEADDLFKRLTPIWSKLYIINDFGDEVIQKFLRLQEGD